MGGLRFVRIARFLLLITPLIVALMFSGFASSLAQSRDDEELEIPEDAQPARYVENIDGDTIIVEMENSSGNLREHKVRLIGTDTPENSYSFGNEPECYGQEATSKTDSVLVTAEDDTIWLEADEADRDPYGRLLRYVWYVSEIDGKVHFLNEDLVREGYALAKTYQPNVARQDELDDAEDAAIREGRGMWLECDASVSMDPSQEEDGEPDDAPIDRTQVPVEDEAEVACSMFDTYDEAQDLLDEFPELAEELDADGDGIACETYFG
jgi:micrococcal nuclease